MTFDVINYTYSGLISIFSMIMGMAYPLINSAITDIDAKYGGSRVSMKVLEEPVYYRFRAFLAISVVVSLLTPFVLYFFNEVSSLMYYWEVFQTVVILCLVVFSIQLFDLILACKLPKKYITSENIASKDVILLAEIARYAARKSDVELYLQCTREVGKRMYNELDSGKVVSTSAPFYDGAINRETCLSQKVQEALAIYTSIICNTDIKGKLYYEDCCLLNMFLSTEQPLRAGDRFIIWKTVQEAARNGNDGFIKQYWIYAVQYYSVFDFSRNYFGANQSQQETFDTEKRTFHEFHTALLSMLLYWGRRKLVGDLLYYSNSLPYSYPLCCNSLQAIFDEWKCFYQCGNSMLLMNLLQEYPLAGNDSGVNSEWVLLHVIESLLAIQILRLKGIHADIIGQESIIDISVGTTIDDNQEYLNVLDRMNFAIKDLDDKYIKEIFSRHQYYSKEDALSIITANIKKIGNEIRETENSPTINTDRIDDLRKKILEEWDRLNIDLGTPVNFVSYVTEKYERKIKFEVPKEMVCYGYKAISFDNLVGTIVQGLSYLIVSLKSEVFRKIGPTVTYRIQYQDIGLALKKLQLSAKYVILYHSINFGLYYDSYRSYGQLKEDESGRKFISGAELIDYPSASTMPYIYVIERDSLPYLTIESKDEESGEKYNQPLETNLHGENISIDTLRNCYVKAFVKLHYPENVKYVKIEIPYILNKMDIDMIKNINYLL